LNLLEKATEKGKKDRKMEKNGKKEKKEKTFWVLSNFNTQSTGL